MRKSQIERNSTETQINVAVNIDGSGQSDIQTGVGFFDHMLTLFSFHSQIDLQIHVIGDLHIDSHHTIEDTGIVLGQAIKQALGDRIGIRRYGSFLLPMDEALVEVALDISGRAIVVENFELPFGQLGNFDLELVPEFFRAFSQQLGLTLHIDVRRGRNVHHIVEASFKGLARALKEAVEVTGNTVSSTKGLLD